MLEIRAARRDDYIPVRDLYYFIDEAMAHTQYDPGWRKDIYPSQEFLVSSIEAGELYMGEQEGALVSCMVLNHACNDGYQGAPWSVDASAPEVLVVHALGVHPDFSGQGIAKQMVQKAIDIAREARLRALRLDVLEGNLPAQRAYTRMGFQYVSTARMFYANTGWTAFRLFELVLEKEGLSWSCL